MATFLFDLAAHRTDGYFVPCRHREMPVPCRFVAKSRRLKSILVTRPAGDDHALPRAPRPKFLQDPLRIRADAREPFGNRRVRCGM